MRRSWILGAVAIAMGLAGTAWAGPPETGLVTANNVDVKKEPSETAEGIVKLYVGRIVKVDQFQDGWVHVQFEKQHGEDSIPMQGWLQKKHVRSRSRFGFWFERKGPGSDGSPAPPAESSGDSGGSSVAKDDGGGDDWGADSGGDDDWDEGDDSMGEATASADDAGDDGFGDDDFGDDDSGGDEGFGDEMEDAGGDESGDDDFGPGDDFGDAEAWNDDPSGEDWSDEELGFEEGFGDEEEDDGGAGDDIDWGDDGE